MLKVFLVNQSVGSVEIEEKYHSFVRELRTDRYVTVISLNCLYRSLTSYHLDSSEVTELQLEKMYGTSPEAMSFIQSLIKGYVALIMGSCA